MGIHIDDKLTWCIHLSVLTKKLKKYRAIIYLIRNNLTINSMKLIYNSLVYSNLLYCNVIWARAAKKYLKPLEIAQKSIIRCLGIDSTTLMMILYCYNY